MDFVDYLISINQTHNLKLEVIEILFASFIQAGIVTRMNLLIRSAFTEERVRAAGERAKFLYERDLILNVVCGWRFIVERYSNSVMKIQHQDEKGDYSMGTGFYFAAGNERGVKPLVITNRHVVENAKQILLFSEKNEEIAYTSITTDSKRDLAFIELNKKLDSPILWLYPAPDILSEIVTVGYPPVPTIPEANQISHLGEVNSFVADFWGNKFFLFSAKTSSGNSGSPIINNLGMVVGIVTQEFFEKDKFFDKGKLPYYAGIPGTEIIDSLNENLFGENFKKQSDT